MIPRDVLRVTWVMLLIVAGARPAACQERKIVGCEEVLFTLTRGYERAIEEAMSEQITKRLLMDAGVSRTAPTIIGWPPFNGFVCVDRRAADVDDVLESSQLGTWGTFSVASLPTQGDAISSAVRFLSDDVVAVGIVSRRAYRGPLNNRGFVPFHRRTMGVFNWEDRKMPSRLDVRPGFPVQLGNADDELIITCDRRVFGIVLPGSDDGARASRPTAGSVTLLAEAVDVPREWQADDLDAARAWASVVDLPQHGWLKRWSEVASDVIAQHHEIELSGSEVCAFMAAMARVELRLGGDALRLPHGKLEIIRRSQDTVDIHGSHPASVKLEAGQLVGLEMRQDEPSSEARPALRWFVLNAWPWIVVVDTWEERVVQWRD